MAILFEMTEDFKDTLEDQGVVFEGLDSNESGLTKIPTDKKIELESTNNKNHTKFKDDIGALLDYESRIPKESLDIRGAFYTINCANQRFNRRDYRGALDEYNEFLVFCKKLKKRASTLPESEIKEYIKSLLLVYRRAYNNRTQYRDIKNKVSRAYPQELINGFIDYATNRIAECNKRLSRKNRKSIKESNNIFTDFDIDEDLFY